MTQNPYSPTFEQSQPEPARLSMLSVVALVASLLCCIPGVGALGALLGTAAIFRISAAKGTKRGMGLAITAVVLGLIGSVLWIGAAIGIGQGVKYLSGLSTDLVRSVESGNKAQLQGVIRNTPITDEQLAAFRQRLDAAAGKFVSGPGSILEFLNDFMSDPSIQAQVQSTRDSAVQIMPVPVTFAKQKGFIILETVRRPDGSEQGNIRVKLADGTTFSLLPDAPPALPGPSPAP